MEQQPTPHFEAPALKYDACRVYMSDGHTTIGNWVSYVSDFVHTHEYLTALIGAVVLTGLSLAYVYISREKTTATASADTRH